MFVIPLDRERNWYRYHHLFADLLKQRLNLGEKATIIELHNKASEWFNKIQCHYLQLNMQLRQRISKKAR